MERREGSMRVLMFPWLAHGHISPFLELAKRLTERRFYIYLCSTPINLNSIKPKLCDQSLSNSIQLVELHLPSLPDLPPHLHTTNGLPPHLMPTLKRAFDMASPEFYNILDSLKPDLLIYDFIQPWAPSLASSLNIPAVHFFNSSITILSFVLHAMENPGLDFPFPSIYLRDCTKTKFDNMVYSSSNDVKDKDRLLQCFDRYYEMILVKSFRELEGKYIDYLSLLLNNKKIVPVGPLVEDYVGINAITTCAATDPNYNNTGDKMEIMKWLDKRESESTVFVSFGSEYFLTKEEREEVAQGLEKSKVGFIWVVRFPQGEKVTLQEALPDGYLERVKGRGMVVEGWAPQTAILGHRSIGGFVCHCGWSSVMESIKFGVPIIGVPMNLDQPLNARLVEDVGVGKEVVSGRKDGRVEREELAKVIREMVVEKDGEGEKMMRRKVREMSNHIREKGDEEMDMVVDELVRLCFGSLVGPLESVSFPRPAQTDS